MTDNESGIEIDLGKPDQRIRFIGIALPSFEECTGELV